MEKSMLTTERKMANEETIKEMLMAKREEFEKKSTQTEGAFKTELRAMTTTKNDALGDSCATPSINGARLKNLKKCLQKFDEALIRVNEGTYGICVKCKESIPLERLQIVPFTAHCVPCKNSLV